MTRKLEQRVDRYRVIEKRGGATFKTQLAEASAWVDADSGPPEGELWVAVSDNGPTMRRSPI